MKTLLYSLFVFMLIGTALGIATSTSVTATQTSTNDIKSELAQARAATARYHRVEQAEAEGYINIGLCEPGEGCHWLNPALLDGHFDPAKPEILLYLPGENGLRLVGVEYVVPLTLSPGVAPEGFTGNEDLWREDSEGVGLWECTAWIWLNNPNGIFEQHNPRAE
jgi:hypothetical protein